MTDEISDKLIIIQSTKLSDKIFQHRYWLVIVTAIFFSIDIFILKYNIISHHFSLTFNGAADLCRPFAYLILILLLFQTIFWSRTIFYHDRAIDLKKIINWDSCFVGILLSPFFLYSIFLISILFFAGDGDLGWVLWLGIILFSFSLITFFLHRVIYKKYVAKKLTIQSNSFNYQYNFSKAFVAIFIFLLLLTMKAVLDAGLSFYVCGEIECKSFNTTETVDVMHDSPVLLSIDKKFAFLTFSYFKNDNNQGRFLTPRTIIDEAVAKKSFAYCDLLKRNGFSGYYSFVLPTEDKEDSLLDCYIQARLSQNNYWNLISQSSSGNKEVCKSFLKLDEMILKEYPPVIAGDYDMNSYFKPNDYYVSKIMAGYVLPPNFLSIKKSSARELNDFKSLSSALMTFENCLAYQASSEDKCSCSEVSIDCCYFCSAGSSCGGGLLVDSSSLLIARTALKNKPAYKTWHDSVNYCNDLVLFGKDDWRLPNRLEIMSSAESVRPKYDSNGDIMAPPKAPLVADGSWTSTECDNGATYISGDQNNCLTKSQEREATCVRNGSVSYNAVPVSKEEVSFKLLSPAQDVQLAEDENLLISWQGGGEDIDVLFLRAKYSVEDYYKSATPEFVTGHLRMNSFIKINLVNNGNYNISKLSIEQKKSLADKYEGKWHLVLVSGNEFAKGPDIQFLPSSNQ